MAHAEQLLDLRRDREAEQRFREVLAADPGSGRALLGLARALNRQDRHAEAEQVVRSALALDPEDAGAHHVLTDVLCDAGDGRGALVSARRALQVDPTSFISHYQHGRALLLVPERRAWAQQSAERAVAIDPDNPDGHNLLGMCLVESKQLERAQESYLRALSIDPDHAYAQNNLAAIAAARGRIARAARLLRSAVAVAPQDPLLQRNLEGVRREVGERLVVLLLAALLIVASVDSLGAPWWARPLVGTACLAVGGAMLIRMRRHLPRGFLAPTDLWRRSGWRTRGSLAFLVLLAGSVALTTFAPRVPVPIEVRDVAPAVIIVSVVGLLTAFRRVGRDE
jgi:tetratricopeptide (TPR) repeat protein